MIRNSFKILIEEVLGVTPNALTASDTRETVEVWTSVADVQNLPSVVSELGLEMDANLEAKRAQQVNC